MSYLVLARKWRPQRFGDIAGQGHITRILRNAIRTNRIAHAFLFTGVRGVGKTTAARILAKALNCEKGPTPDPCDECTQCAEIVVGSSMDVYEIDGASNRGIDEVRQIIENVRYQPAQSRFKIYIIDEVHQVTKDAFNALLKTLEEPPSFVKFILATTEPHRLPETILSRCQRFDFRRIAIREMIQRLSEIAKQEGLRISDAALYLLAREAEGSMRDAQSLLEQVLSYVDPETAGVDRPIIEEDLVQDILGLAERKTLYDVSAAVIQGDAKRCVDLVGEVVAQGRDLPRLSRDLVEHFRNLLVARLTEGQKETIGEGRSPSASAAPLLDLPDQEIEDITRQVSSLSVDTLMDYFTFMSAGDEEVARSAFPRFALEATLVRLSTLPRTIPVSEIVERLEGLERRLSGGKRSEPHRSAPEPSHVAEMSDPDADRSDQSLPVHDAPGDPQREVWGRFVGFVGKEKKFLASHLEQVFPLKLPPGKLEIGVEDRHHLNYLQDADHMASLKDLARRFFDAEVLVALTPVARKTSEKKEAGLGSGQAKKAEEDDVVKAALRIFGGSIKEVRK